MKLILGARMKTIMFIVFFICFFACQKSENEKNIIGKWQLIDQDQSGITFLITYNADNTGIRERICTKSDDIEIFGEYTKIEFNYSINDNTIIDKTKDSEIKYTIILLSKNELILKKISTIYSEERKKEQDKIDKSWKELEKTIQETNPDFKLKEESTITRYKRVN